MVGKLIQKSLPLILSDAIVAFLDGSSTLKDGITGAAAYILKPEGSDGFRAVRQYAIPLEVDETNNINGTNNEAELIAVLLVLDAVDQDFPPECLLFLLTDSDNTYGFCHKHYISKTGNAQLIQKLTDRLDDSATKRAISVFRIPTHVGIIGNELADQLAGVASKWVAPLHS